MSKYLHRPEAPEIIWDDEEQPQSTRFNDVYFSRASGLEESRFVFLQHNELSRRWAELDPRGGTFTIAETGFGTGLNFLAAWQLWQQVAPPRWQLHFISAERFPLDRETIAHSHRAWPELSELSEQLLTAYPRLSLPGVYRCRLADDRISLSLLVGDASACFADLAQSRALETLAWGVDAWFLDGFAPPRNPQMWNVDLFDAIADLSAKGCTAATFSAAALVRENLRRAGFAIEKVPGFGHKRHMLKASFIGEAETKTEDPATSPESHPRAAPAPARIPVRRQWLQRQPSHSHQGRALVIGAGLAGCHSAHALAKRGWQVDVLDSADSWASGASGNPQAILYARLSLRDGPLERFNFHALEFAQRFYQHHWQQAPSQEGQRCGLLGCERSHEESTALAALYPELLSWVDAAQASNLAGVPLNKGGLWQANSGWINPRWLCAQLLQHRAISLHCRQTALSILRHGQGWRVHSNEADFDADVVVIANAIDAAKLPGFLHLPLKPVAGQISLLPTNAGSEKLRCVITGDGYCLPAIGGLHSVGASYRLGESATDLRASEHLANLKLAQELLPDFRGPEQGGRAAVRCATPDYLPFVGPMPDAEKLKAALAPWRKNARQDLAPRLAAAQHDGPLCHDGLYAHFGHGSRGLAYAPLCAEVLASQISGQALPIDATLYQALHPARFLVRDLIRNRD